MSSLFYFGKIPARGDFVKSASAAAVIQQLDTWATRALELMLDDPDWKRRYDESPPVAFLFTGTRARHMIAGRLVASRDASQRRFPLLVGTLGPVDDPLGLLAHAPLILAQAWSQFEQHQRSAIESTQPQGELAGIEASAATLGDVRSAAQRLREFTDRHTLATLEARFGETEPKINLRRSLLALGILLQPMLTQARPDTGKSLSCPLPPDPDAAVLMATYWMALVTPFLARVNVELGLLRTQTPRGPVLTISFGGAQPRALEAVWRQDTGSDHVIDIRDVEWVEDYVADAQHLGKLASYLQHPALTLTRATHTFRETFLGQ